VAQCLGVDAKKYKYHVKGGDNDDQGVDPALPTAILKTETQKSLKDRSIARFNLICPFCYKEYEFPGIYHTGKVEVSGMICPNQECAKKMPVKFIKNRVYLFLR